MPTSASAWPHQIRQGLSAPSALRSKIEASVVHLAGASIGDVRWTAQRKALLRDSRVAATDHLVGELAGLGKTPKQVPCKYFYDSRGSELFDRICQLDEYYLTRSELAIMDRFASEMGAQIGSGAMLRSSTSPSLP